MNTPLLYASLCCPLDGQPLQQQANSWRCTQGHSFDTASQGYVNLLPVQKKRTLDPGDSKEMVGARRRFLASGVYAPLAQQLAACIQEADLPPSATCLDAGCGEGYYLRYCQAHLSSRSLRWVGLDISKWAVLAAAKKNGDMRWLVGSNANLPLLPSTVDYALCMFGFPVYEEFARVLKPEGTLLMVEAGPEHLRELREIIYPELKGKSDQWQVPDGFVLQQRQRLQCQVTLNSPELIADLLLMTPHLYRASAAGLARAQGLTHLVVSVDVEFRTLRRRP